MRFLLLIFCSCLCAEPLDVEVKSASVALMNAATGALLYEKKAHEPSFPASTTKIATALFIISEKQPAWDKKLTVSSDSLRQRKEILGSPPHWWDSDGTRLGLKIGELLSVEGLLHGLLLVSGNDAANVLAEGLSGSTPVFVEEMNAYLQRIGCKETHFVNPHGCHHPDHQTTAYDLCLMTKEALLQPKFREIVETLSYTKPKTNKQGAVEIKQANRLLQPGAFYYPKAIGVKTGWHSFSRNCLVAAAQHQGRVLIAALLGSENRTNRYTDAIRLFEAAFAEQPQTRRLFGQEHLFTREIFQAKTPLFAGLKEDLSISFFPAEEPLCRAFVAWSPPALPIVKGQVVGEVRVVDERGQVIAHEGLIAKEDVKGTFSFRVQKLWQRLFR